MQIDKKWLSRAAAQEGVVRDTLEKYVRGRISKIRKIKDEPFPGQYDFYICEYCGNQR